MNTAELIQPKSLGKWSKKGYLPKSGKISCGGCKLSYLRTEYKILFKNKKLAYFFLPDPLDPIKMMIVCHDCLFKILKKTADKTDKPTELIILDEEEEYRCKFYSQDFLGDYEDFSDGFESQNDRDDEDDLPFFFK